MISKEAPSPMTPTFNKGLVETVFSDRSIAVERVCTDEGLFELKADWERLFAQSSAQNPFLSWEWMAAWWRHLGAGKLHLLFVRRQGALIGIAPFYQREIRLGGISFRALSFLGDEAVGSDHLDFLSRKGCEDEVAEAVVQAWLQRSPRLGFHRPPAYGGGVASRGQVPPSHRAGVARSAAGRGGLSLSSPGPDLGGFSQPAQRQHALHGPPENPKSRERAPGGIHRDR
ncbi:MAG: hypothetical protein MPW15_27790 [Candidatus Manganitrophus sp.]|nr:hypothetical protein [Candidatus Manganitrophus sp.]